MKPYQCHCCRRLLDAEREPKDRPNTMRINQVRPADGEPVGLWVMICPECLYVLDQTGMAPYEWRR